MGFELPNGKTARNLQEQVKFLSEKLKDLYAAVNKIGIRVLVVDELPAEGASATIYLVPAEEASQDNIYNEYMWIEDEWELIGSTAIDLSDYMTLSTDQTVSGEKTFSNGLKIGSDMLLSRSSDFNGLEIGNDKNLVLNGIIYPKYTSQNDIGSSSYKWKDLYLSGKIYLPNNSTIETGSGYIGYTYNNLFYMAFGNSGVVFYKTVLPNSNNAQDLGSSSAAWKRVYCEEVKTNYIGKAGLTLYFNGLVFAPEINNTNDLGSSGHIWKDLYLSGNLTDGTNTVSVAQLASGIGGTYRHVIYIEGASADINIAVNLNSATAITTQAALAAINNNVMGGTATLDEQSRYRIVAIDSVGTVGSIVYLDETGQHTLNIVDIYQDVVNQL